MRILVVCANIGDPTSFWRGWGPVSQLGRYEYGCEMIAPEQLTWMNTIACSIAVFQRPFDAAHLRGIKNCKLHGLPVVVDYDDYLWEVPRGNPAKKFYTPQQIEVVNEIILTADAVTCSTEIIAQKVREIGAKDVVVIRNALPEYYKWREGPQTKQVWWRGSKWHRHDISAVADDFVRVVNANPDWRWLFGGSDPDWITERFTHDNWAANPTVELTEYHRSIAATAPAIVVSPLIDCTFNRAKSNIAWIEAALAGGYLLSPDFEQFRGLPGVTTYIPGQFGDTLQELLTTAEAKSPDMSAARKMIDRDYRLGKVNEQRWDLYRRLLGIHPRSMRKVV